MRIKLTVFLNDPFFLILPIRSLLVRLDHKIESNAITQGQIEPGITIEVPTVDLLGINSDLFTILKTIDQKLRIYKAYLLIQGSYADNTTTNYSDLDIILLYEYFDKKILKLKIDLEELIVRIDPLQHHGVFLIHTRNFNHYWQGGLPIKVLENSVNLSCKNITIPIGGVLPDLGSSSRALESSISTLESFLESDFQMVGVYKWKWILSILMLVPTLVLASKSKIVHKSESFSIIKDQYSNLAWSVIKKATYIRKNWPSAKYFAEYTELRATASQKPIKDPILVMSCDFEAIKVNEDFFKGLALFIKETKMMIANDGL